MRVTRPWPLYGLQYVGRILRSHESKTTAEVHDYLDARTGVLAAMLAKRAPGCTGHGFSDPRRLANPKRECGLAGAPADLYYAAMILCVRDAAAERRPARLMFWS